MSPSDAYFAGFSAGDGKRSAASWLASLTGVFVALAPIVLGHSLVSTLVFACGAFGLLVALSAFFAPAQAPGGRMFSVLLIGVAVAGAWVFAASFVDGHATDTLRRLPDVSSVLRFCLCGLALLAGALGAVSEPDGLRLPNSVARMGVLIAAYALFENWVDPTRLMWMDKTDYVGFVTAPFVGHNAAGCFYGMCALLWMARATAYAPKYRGLRETLLLGIPASSTKGLALCGAAFVVCLAALAGSESRGALLATLVGAFWIVYARFPILRARGSLVSRVLGWALLGAVLLGLFDYVGGRVQSSGLLDPSRFAVWKSALSLAAERPWTGFGLGAFADAFPLARSDATGSIGVWDVAHDTYLETAVELGFPTMIGLAGAVFLACYALVRGGARDAAVAGIAGASIAAAVHSLVDFPVQVPGVAVPCLALAGWGLVRAAQRSHSVAKV